MTMKVITVVWDDDDDILSINHEGCNRFEAVGMLCQALDVVSCWGSPDEVVEEDGSEEG